MTNPQDAWERRLPVYFVVDTSHSMRGDPISIVTKELEKLVESLQCDPMAFETVWMSLICFATEARQIVPLTEIGDFQMPSLKAGGRTNLGAALRLLEECIARDVRKQTDTQKGDWRPLAFVFTDGGPSDSYKRIADGLRGANVANVVGCAAGEKAKVEPLKRLTDAVVRIDSLGEGSLGAFFEWVTQSIAITGASVQVQGDGPVRLPALPLGKGVQIIPL